MKTLCKESSYEGKRLSIEKLLERVRIGSSPGFYCTMDSPLVVFKCVEDSWFALFKEDSNGLSPMLL
jgi:hypothetical protein